MKASFYPRFRNKKCYVQISIIDGIKLNGSKNRKLISTGVIIGIKDWDKKRKVIVKHPDSFQLNSELKLKLNCVEEIILRNRLNNISLNEIIAEYDRIFRRTQRTVTNLTSENTIYFLDHVRVYFDAIEKSGKFKSISLRSKRKVLHTFENCFKKNKLNPTLDELSIEHWDLFENYCINILHLQNVTINSHRKELFVWMNYFIKHGVTRNLFFKNITKLNAPEKKYPILTLAEVDKIRNLNLIGTIYFKYQIIMMLQITTGLRIGDLFSLKKDNFDFNNGLLHLTTSKNKSNISIPIPNYLIDLIRSNISRITSFSMTKYNLQIKNICEMAEIKDKVETIKYSGAKQIRKFKPKYLLISSHSLRRTMITNSLRNGISVELLMRIIGTRDRKVFDKYIQYSNEDAINELRKIQ